MENQYFEYKLPKLSKDKEHKKWYVRYAIKYPTDSEFKYHKEYGRFYFKESLNLIDNLKQREKKFKELIEIITAELRDGIDKKNPAMLKQIIQKNIEENSKFSFDSCFDMYMLDKGYINPIPKKSKSSVTIRMFLKNQLRPYLDSINLVHDMRLVTINHLKDYLKSNKKSPTNPNGWTNNTYNTKITYLGSFFSHLFYNDIIPQNPVTKIKNLDRTKSTRFGIFTIEERDIYFKYLESTDFSLMTITKFLYYSFIRFSELTRIKVSDIQLDKLRIRIHPDDSKTGKANFEYVQIREPLKDVITAYLDRYPHQPDWYIFGKGLKPSKYEARPVWFRKYNPVIVHLRKEHPGLFDRLDLLPYSWKHSGISHMIMGNLKTKSTMELLQTVMQLARHTNFTTTQKYWKNDLGYDLEKRMDIIEL